MAGETELDLDFESGNFSAWGGFEEHDSHQHAIVTNPISGWGDYSAMIEVHPGDLWANPGNNTVRCLMVKGGTGETVGQEYWWAFKAFIPSSITPVRSNLFWELHHPSSLYNLTGRGVAPHAVHMRDVGGGVMKWCARLAAGNGTNTGWAEWHPNEELADLEYDVWTSFIVHLDLSESSGTAEYFIDTTGTIPFDFGEGTPAWSISGVPTMPFSTSPSVHNVSLYTEMGLYTGGPSTDKTSIVYTGGSRRRLSAADARAALGGDTGPPPDPDAPGSITTSADIDEDVDPVEVTFNGSYWPNSQPTTYYFEWGTTTSYGNVTETLIDPFEDDDYHDVAVPGVPDVGTFTFEEGILYHYRLVVTNTTATTYSNDVTFSFGTVISGLIEGPINLSSIRFRAKQEVPE